MYKIIFMGTPEFAVESLDALYKTENKIILCVSQPDKPSGRNLKLTPTPVKQYAVDNNIPIMQPEQIKKNADFLDKIKQLAPDLIVVVAYGKILPKELLEIPKYGCINVHGSLLPYYRGAAPIQWSVINGDSQTGITTMFMDEGMDTGDMLLQEKVIIDENDTYGTVYEKLKVLGGQLIVKTISNLESIVPEKQPMEFTIAPMIEKEMGKLDFNKSAVELHNLVRGFNPMPGATINIQENIYKIWETTALKNFEKQYSIGQIICANSKDGLLIQTRDGVLSINTIQAQNAKRMNVKDYLRGNKIEEGIII